MKEKRTEISLEALAGKQDAIDAVDEWRFKLGLSTEDLNGQVPWGAYWKIDKTQTGHFLRLFFPEMVETHEKKMLNLSPKLLLIAPHERISWQYHERRTENWRVLAGEVSVKLSRKEDEPVYGFKFVTGDQIRIDQGEKHRLIGEYGWGLVAEVWEHTDPENPSNEEDVVRLKDDYGR